MTIPVEVTCFASNDDAGVIASESSTIDGQIQAPGGAKEVSIHHALAVALQAEWPLSQEKDRLKISDWIGKRLEKVVRNPDLDNEVENVLRSMLHGFHFPVLAALPLDIKFFELVMKPSDLGTLHVLNSRNWNTDVATENCASVEDNWKAIWNRFCSRGSPHFPHTDAAAHTPSSVILSMLGAKSIHPRSVVAVGTSMSTLTLLDGNHRSVAMFGSAWAAQRSSDIHTGQDLPSWCPHGEKEDSHDDVHVIIGLSHRFLLDDNTLICSLEMMPEAQLRAGLDASEHKRGEIYADLELQSNAWEAEAR